MMQNERGRVLPAYGRQLMQRRFAGEHLLYVSLLLGEEWWQPGHEGFTRSTAWLGLKPREYRRGGVDFRCVAGAAVTVFDLDVEAGRDRRFFDLLNDLAQVSGPLLFVTAAELYDELPGKAPIEVWASRYAFECKLSDPGRSWPWWWPESLDKSHGEKVNAWIATARKRAGSGLRHRQRAA